jgi:HMG (high mobility group) box
MPKQTKKTETTPLVAEPVAAPAPVVVAAPAAVPEAAPAEAKKRGRKAKPKAQNAAALTIMLHAKRPATDYLFFCEEVRPKIIAENPGMSFIDIGREQGRRWKALPTEVKNIYKAKWEEDKKRYESEKAVVEENRQANPEIFTVAVRKTKKVKKTGAKRARTAFIIFC